jgi:hypothetical protein
MSLCLRACFASQSVHSLSLSFSLSLSLSLSRLLARQHSNVGAAGESRRNAAGKKDGYLSLALTPLTSHLDAGRGAACSSGSSGGGTQGTHARQRTMQPHGFHPRAPCIRARSPAARRSACAPRAAIPAWTRWRAHGSSASSGEWATAAVRAALRLHGGHTPLSRGACIPTLVCGTAGPGEHAPCVSITARPRVVQVQGRAAGGWSAGS